MTTHQRAVVAPTSSLSRFDKALAFVDRRGFGLEIGPSYSPIAPKRAGFNVQIVDYMTADGLREKFKDEDVDFSQIEDVDFVWSGEPLYELVGGKDKYDWVIASHVIEHIPDLATFLRDCEAVLRPQGVVSLIVPDKRYCFDHFRPLTTTGQVLDAFEERRTRPTAGSVFDALANYVALNGAITWSSEEKGVLARTEWSTFERARHHWELARSSNDYVDVHVWSFTPTSFRLILQDLNSLEFTHLQVAHEFDTAGFEFFVTLGQGPGSASSTERIAALRQIDKELAGAAGVELPSAKAQDEAKVAKAGAAMEVSHLERKLILFKRGVFEKTRGIARRRR